jgi:CheY-like chemotaxis protein
VAAVLVVDDDPEIRDALADALEGRGYDVAVANHGGDALDWLSKSPAPCLIVLDLMMPVMDGHEFISRQKRNPAIANIPVVIITAGRDPYGTKVVEAVDVLHKPFGFESLLKFVQQYCH